MTITNIVNNVNARMNYTSFTYPDMHTSMDAAIDRLNTEWRIDIPMITDNSEMVPDGDDPSYLVPYNYESLPDDFIRQYLIPYIVYRQYINVGQDGSPEMQEALLSLAALSERYIVAPGQTEITKDKDINYEVLQRDTTDQFADGNSNYGEINPKNNLVDPLGDY